MKAVIVCVSVSHGNTLRVAEALGDVVDAKVVAPEDVDPGELAAADLVGFGSGVFHGRMHPRLTRFARALPTAPAPRGRAFVFATSGLPEPPWAPFTRPLTRVLAAKGFGPAGTFSCRAYDTWAPFRLVGGIKKQRPDEQDMAAVREFGARLRDGGAASY